MDHLQARDQPNSQYLNNRIRTTKYTILSFLPRNLFEQFHRFANLYFLFIVLLNWVPAVNAFGESFSVGIKFLNNLERNSRKRDIYARNIDSTENTRNTYITR